MKEKVILKKIGIGIITAALLLSQPMQLVYAEEENNPEATEEAADANPEEKTKEQIAAEEAAKKQASYDTPVDTNGLENWPTGPNVYAASAIVMDIDSGAVLYGKQIDEKRYPASITKLLTVLVALENANLTDKITFTDECLNFLEWDDANIGMRVGEEITLEEALYGVLLASANEVSYAVAKNVGENLGIGYDGFIELMNERAQELGCKNSHWVNANGLHDENHYTTAYDMALIASAVYQKEDFQRIEQTLEYKLGKTNLVEEERILDQNHKMLWPENYYYYPYAKAGKTGYTDQSKTTLVTMADNGNMRLAAVVLGDYGVDAYEDTRNMFEYGFGNFRKVMLSEQSKSEDIESFADSNAYIVLPEAVDFTNVDCEIQLSDTDGNNVDMATAVYTYQGNIVGKAEVKVSDIYKEKQSAAVTAKKDSKKSAQTEAAKDGEISWKGYLPLIVMGGITVAILFVFLPIWLHLQRKRRKNRRRR